MANSFGSGGALFVRDKKSPNAADYGGDVTLEGEVLDYILREAENGNPVKIEFGGWKRQGRNNTTFISLSANIPYSVRQGQSQPAPQRRTNESFQTSRGTYPSRSSEGFNQQQARPQRQELNEGLGRNATRQRQPNPLDDDIPFN